jgi:hypothetical protein
VGATLATYNGHTINLRKGWGGAKACLVWRSHAILECFSTDSALKLRESQLKAQMASTAKTAGAAKAAASYVCSSPLNLYSGMGFGGLHLALWDEGYWQQLSWYGFANATESFIDGACGFHLAQGNYGYGWWYPGYTGAWSYTWDMGSWNNTTNSVYIQ